MSKCSTVEPTPRRAVHNHGGTFALRELMVVDFDRMPADTQCSDCWAKGVMLQARETAVGRAS